jgi:hypothetical protein
MAMEGKARGKQAEAEKKAAQSEYRALVKDLTARKIEEAASAQQQIQQSRELSLVEQSLAVASAADGNVAGNSVDALMNSLARKGQQSADTAEANFDSVDRQLTRELVSGGSRFDSRVNAAPQPLNPFAAGLGLAGSAAQMAMPYIRKPR